MISRAKFMGGSQDLGTKSADFDFVPAAGRAARVAATVAAIKAKLPAATTFKHKGGPIAILWNYSATNSLNLADVGGNTIVAVAAGKIAKIALLNNSTVNGIWIAIVRTKLS